jgi:hypothetical protein
MKKEKIVKTEEPGKEDTAQHSKPVSERIFDKFDEYTGVDALFSGINKDLSIEIRKTKSKKVDIIAILKKSEFEKK